MFKIIVVLITIATGQPYKSIVPADEFSDMETCLQFIAKNREEVTAQVKQQSLGQMTLKAWCVDMTPGEPA